MSHKIISVTDETNGNEIRHVVIDRGDGSFESFPVDEDNPRYQAWLEAGGVIEG